MQKYALIVWSTNNKKAKGRIQRTSIQYMSVDEHERYPQHDDLDWVSPHDVDVVFNEEKVTGDPLLYLVSNPIEGLVFACRHGLMSLFIIMLYRFQHDYQSGSQTFEEVAMKAMRAAIEGGHRDILHKCRLELMDPDLSGFACDSKKLDILVFEYPQKHESIKCFFIENNDNFVSILDRYKADMDNAEFKDMINKTLYYATESRYIDIVYLLISYGADEFKDAIYSAAAHSSFFIVELMMENVNDEMQLIKMKRSAVLGALKSNSFDILEKYYVDDGSFDLNTIMSKSGNKNIWKFCIEKGATLDSGIMKRVIYSEDKDMMKFLIDMGCDVTEMIREAINMKDTETVMFLIECGKDVLQPHDYGSLIANAMKNDCYCSSCSWQLN